MVQEHTLDQEGRSLFARAPSYVSYFVFLLLLSLSMVVLDHKYQKLEVLRASLNTVLFPVYHLAGAPAQVGIWLKDSVMSKGSLLAHTKTLSEANLRLSQKLQKYETLEVENRRLRDLLNMSEQYAHDRVQIASVLRLDQTRNSNELTLDKGSSDGVYVGQAVLDEHGLLGQVVHVSYRSSKLLLLDSTKHFTPVQVVRNSYHSIAAGTGGNDTLQLMRVKEGADISIGDMVVTSGMGGLFPAGYKVGTVAAITPQKDHTLGVQIAPFANNQQVEEVLLIWPPEQTTIVEQSTPDEEA